MSKRIHVFIRKTINTQLFLTGVSGDDYHRLNKKVIEIVFHCNNFVQVDEVAEAVEESSENEVFVN